LQDFERGAVIAADGDRLQAKLVISVDDYGAETLCAEEERVDGNLYTLTTDLHGEMDLRVAAGKQFAGVIRNVDFDAKSAGRELDRLRRADDFSFKLFAGVLGEFEIGRKSGMDDGA